MLHRPLATIHGYPRQGPDRELKTAIERYWRGRYTSDDLTTAVASVRTARLAHLRDAGLGELPVGDFSLYDHMLDLAVMVDAIPARHADHPTGTAAGRLDRLFAMARGDDAAEPLEMTKWFDTNYHYLVPEIDAVRPFALHADELLAQVAEAGELGVPVRVVLVGPVTFLALSKAADDAPDGFDPLDRLAELTGVYADLLAGLAAAGVAWVQFDEPILVTDVEPRVLDAVAATYATLGGLSDRPKLLLASYFGDLGPALDTVLDAPVDGFAFDLTGNGARDADRLAGDPRLSGKRVLAGVISGRNVWRGDVDVALRRATTLLDAGAEVDIASASSLLHVPHDVERETGLDPEIKSWLAFADQKLGELTLVARALDEGADAVAAELTANRELLAARASSPAIVDTGVRERVAALTDDQARRRSDYPARAKAQGERLGLPDLPTTTIGSFPQTGRLRRARAELRKGNLDAEGYDAVIAGEIDEVIALQERLGLDVVVHGEPERNDMVQYFADQLTGVLSTDHGWVQSYGTRCVRPPIIAGDIKRRQPMTVRWSSYAQSRTDKPVKGMLTGPVTMLAWSFVRDDQPEGETATQMALALRDEVVDLEAAGLGVIQVDEPALRETLPLRTADQAEYLAWAVRAFRLTTSGVADATQIHTHMCYAEFGDIMPAIVALDADVISLEASRSGLGVVAELAAAQYPNEVGPGVWDIHSPRVPDAEHLDTVLGIAVDGLPKDRIWVNPDCGLKTRGYAEVEPSLTAMVAAAKRARTA